MKFNRSFKLRNQKGSAKRPFLKCLVTTLLQSNKSYRFRLPTNSICYLIYIYFGWRLKSLFNFFCYYFILFILFTLDCSGGVQIKNTISQHVTRILFVMDQLSKLFNFSFSFVIFPSFSVSLSLFLFRIYRCFGVNVQFKFLRNKSKQWHQTQHPEKRRNEKKK